MENISILSVPGLASSGPSHWQTLWEQKFPNAFKRVEQENWDLPYCETWVNKLNDEIQNTDRPTYLVAHSLGCITIVHWAKQFDNPNIKGAFLVAPADVENAKNLNFVVFFNPIPQNKLPFESMLLASTDDRYTPLEISKRLAHNWGSKFINVGANGHINANSNLGNWNEGLDYLNEFIKTKSENEITENHNYSHSIS